MQIWLYCPAYIYSGHSSMIWPLPTSPASFFTTLFVFCAPVTSDHLRYHFLALCNGTYYFLWMKSGIHITPHSAVKTAQFRSLGRLPLFINKIYYFVISLHFALTSLYWYLSFTVLDSQILDTQRLFTSDSLPSSCHNHECQAQRCVPGVLASTEVAFNKEMYSTSHRKTVFKCFGVWNTPAGMPTWYLITIVMSCASYLTALKLSFLFW